MEVSLKKLSDDATDFVANGVKYYIKDNLSFERFRWMQKLSINVGLGRDWQELYKNIDKIVELFNKGKSVEAFGLLNALKNSDLRDLDKRHDPLFLMCTLFIVAEGEDVTEWNEKMANEKISNWNKEFDPFFFIRLGINLVPGFLERYTTSSQDISEVAKMIEELEAPK